MGATSSSTCDGAYERADQASVDEIQSRWNEIQFRVRVHELKQHELVNLLESYVRLHTDLTIKYGVSRQLLRMHSTIGILTDMTQISFR
jgi:hypothetical protein